MLRLGAAILTLTALLLGLPLLGAILAGNSVCAYLEFPPVTRYVQHARFSWIAFLILSLAALLCLGILTFLFDLRRQYRHEHGTRYPLPWWGWVAVIGLLSCWMLAWTRFDWFRPLQSFTFAPLWISYIVTINAMTLRRTGACLITRQPCYLAVLFPASAMFWWYFEYLNRFVQNWYYIGVEGYTPWQYAMHATIAFSTVLPAVISTMEFLKSFPALRRTRTAIRLPWVGSRLYTRLVLVFSCLGLIGVSLWPDYLFPLIWIAPVLMLECLLGMLGQETVLSGVRQGDWYVLGLAMVGALICGFVWELWNYYSDPKWIYSIPFVHRFEVFEMPILGYIGYLPFGLQCWVVGEQVRRLAVGHVRAIAASEGRMSV